MLKVNVIGIGPGNPDLLTGEARKAIAKSTILAGDKRMVGQFGSGKKVCPTIKLAELAEVAANADAEKDVLGILVSGDVGFFSLAKTIAGKLPQCDPGTMRRLSACMEGSRIWFLLFCNIKKSFP